MLRKIIKYSITGVPGLIYDLQKGNFETVTQSESSRINDIIKIARQEGLSEISVEMSKDFAEKLSLSGEVPIEGINVHANAESGITNNRKVVLSIKLNSDDTYLQIEKLARLHKQEILSESEFATAKQRLIDKL
jgi:hypothetical protein